MNLKTYIGSKTRINKIVLEDSYIEMVDESTVNKINSMSLHYFFKPILHELLNIAFQRLFSE